jgi:hypothetical protein
MIKQLDDKWYQSKYLLIKDEGRINPTSKTRVFFIYSRISNIYLGCIKWYAHWRKYVFFPVEGGIYDNNCLREIVEFSEFKNAEYRKGFKKRAIINPNRIHPRFRKSVEPFSASDNADGGGDQSSPLLVQGEK